MRVRVVVMVRVRVRLRVRDGGSGQVCASSRLWPPVASECEPPTCASPHTAYSAGSSPSVSRTCARLADYSLL